jgi:hypothetical protein
MFAVSSKSIAVNCSSSAVIEGGIFSSRGRMVDNKYDRLDSYRYSHVVLNSVLRRGEYADFPQPVRKYFFAVVNAAG